MKRITALLLCIFLTASLCACKAQSKAISYARKSWSAIGSADMDVDRICFMEYTSRTYLSDDVLETAMYEELPKRGCVILFDSLGVGDEYACFLNDRGELAFTFDYEENYRLYEKHYENFSIYDIQSGEKAVEYLTNCNYISSMLRYGRDGQELNGTHQKNVWYCFSDEQIKLVVGRSK